MRLTLKELAAEANVIARTAAAITARPPRKLLINGARVALSAATITLIGGWALYAWLNDKGSKR